jgi:CRISPR-associated endonuclease/helicase Cas3
VLRGSNEKAGFPDPPDPRCRHERITFGFLEKVLKGTGLDPFAASAIARAVVVHHGYWNESPRGVADKYAKAQSALFDLLKRVTGVDEWPKNTPANLSAFGMRLAGHIVLSDWIASNEKFITDGRLKNEIDPSAYFVKSKEVAREWISGLDFERNQEAGQPERIVASARPIQKVLLDNDIPPGLVIVEAPMGEGKTEAAWILAEKWRQQASMACSWPCPRWRPAILYIALPRGLSVPHGQGGRFPPDTRYGVAARHSGAGRDAGNRGTGRR